mmetsp:Transcript_77749/g.137070  ORF Transcript_77749/g.137070 Transcript_77749/m.137070 type:complete len:211 (-) Transcript_77749:516-1148(-)
MSTSLDHSVTCGRVFSISVSSLLQWLRAEQTAPNPALWMGFSDKSSRLRGMRRMRWLRVMAPTSPNPIFAKCNFERCMVCCFPNKRLRTNAASLHSFSCCSKVNDFVRCSISAFCLSSFCKSLGCISLPAMVLCISRCISASCIRVLQNASIPLQPSGLWLTSRLSNLLEPCSRFAMKPPMEWGTWLWLRSKLRRFLDLRREDNNSIVLV